MHHHVGALQQIPEHAQSILALEIQHHRALALAHLDREPVEAQRTEVGGGRVDLDHVGAILGQRAGAARTSQHVGQVQHPDAFEDLRRRTGRRRGVWWAATGADGAGGRCSRRGLRTPGPFRVRRLHRRLTGLCSRGAGRGLRLHRRLPAPRSAVGRGLLQLPQHRFQVAVGGGARIEPPVGRPGERNLHPQLPHLAMARIVDVDREAGGKRLRRVQPFVGGELRRERHLAVQQLQPVRGRLLGEQLGQPLADAPLPRLAQHRPVLDVVGQLRVVVQVAVHHAGLDQLVVEAHRLQKELAVVGVAAREQVHPAAVGGAVAVVRTGVHAAEPAQDGAPAGAAGQAHVGAQERHQEALRGARHDRHAVADRLLRHPVQQDAGRGQRRAQQRHLDHLAAPALRACVQSEGHRQRAVDGPVGGGQRDRRVHRRRSDQAAGRVEVGKQAAGRVQHSFERADVGLALVGRRESGQRKVDQARMSPRDHLRAEAEAVHHPRAEVLDHHVGGGDQPPGGRQAGLALQVQFNPRLAAVVHRIGGLAGAGSPRAGPVDLDHLRALVGQQHAGQRPGDVVAEVDHPHPRQRRCAVSRHGSRLPATGRARL